MMHTPVLIEPGCAEFYARTKYSRKIPARISTPGVRLEQFFHMCPPMRKNKNAAGIHLLHGASPDVSGTFLRQYSDSGLITRFAFPEIFQ